MNDPTPQKRALYQNPVSQLGVLVIATSATLILFALVSQFTIGSIGPYVGIITYLVFPGIAVAGVVLVLVGMRWEAGRRKKHGALDRLPYPRVDLNEQRTRRRFVLLMVGGSVVAAILAWAMYRGFLYTESVQFCGAVCHTVMQPEYTAYQDSAHARVPCVDCHVGAGADWYVRSKLSGVHQVYAVAFHTYDRPIPVPIRDLRPARETCEKCHWPDKFFGATLLQLPHFRYDEANTAEQISLTLKTGGGSKEHGASTGIHWHMVVDNTVRFAATDKQLQHVPWVEVTHSDGTRVVYRSRRQKVTDAELAALEKRGMDCMDCHNRPTHGFPNPDGAVDEVLFRGLVPADLPWIKKVAVEALMEPHPNRAAAHEAIAQRINGFYAEDYPKVASARAEALHGAVSAVVGIYDRGVFPAMNVDWRTYPSNIGHRYWPGCFRCHDREHVSDDGQVLAADCASTCHTQPVRGRTMPLGEVDLFASQAWHPWEMPAAHVAVEAHAHVLCHECHGAGQRPKRECKDCH